MLHLWQDTNIYILNCVVCMLVIPALFIIHLIAIVQCSNYERNTKGNVHVDVPTMSWAISLILESEY